MQLNELVLHIPDAVDSEFCKKYINLLEEQNERQALPNRNFSIRYLRDYDLSEILGKVESLAATYQKNVPFFNLTKTSMEIEIPSLKKYHKGMADAFDSHVDACDFKSTARFLVFLFYLNDVEEGGCTVFPQLNLKFKPKAGSVLLFPPYWMMLHRGEAPITSDKYIISTYLRFSPEQ